MGDTDSKSDRVEGPSLRKLFDEIIHKKSCIGIGDDLAFGFLLVQNNYNYTYFPYHLITDSPENEPGTVRIRCGSSLATIKGLNLSEIYNAISQHRLLWLFEGEPISRPESSKKIYIESIDLVSATRLPSGGEV